jgi:hypothetical protein
LLVLLLARVSAVKQVARIPGHLLARSGEYCLIFMVSLDEVLREYRPGSYDPPWSWDDEEENLLSRICVCCGKPGHYQLMLEAYIRENGVPGAICLGTDGRVWDGHHRIIAAKRLDIGIIGVEEL